MVENKSTILGIIALIIGATGLGLGAFSFISLQAVEGEQGLPGEDGQDGIDGIVGIDGINGTDAPGYYCDSAAEVQQALDSIGTGSGKIILTESITLNSKINISGGGSYVIQGQGGGTIINCSGDWNAFDITNATSCIIKDLKIDSSDVGSSTAIININEINDNPVYIEKIQIIGDSDLYGYGIHIGSGNVWVSDCYISEVNKGIFQTSSIGIAHIYDNIISEYSNGIEIYGDNNHISYNSMEIGGGDGIRIGGSHNMVTNNLIREIINGIILYGGNNTIKDNIVYSIQGNGIYSLDSDYNVISGNSIFDVEFVGIYLDYCTSNVISGNLISDIGAYGIFLVNCTSNVISGNQISFGNHNGIDIIESDYNVISGNSIFNLSSTSSFAGIEIFINADFNTITANGIFNCTGYGGGNGYGIKIFSADCNDNTVLGNTALNNDYNWDDSGTNTFGNSTNNNFG